MNSAPPNITLPGDAVGFYECALHSKVTGYLQSIPVDKGDWVKKRQVLATIEVPELKQNLARAKADFTIQKLTYQRLKNIREQDPKVVAEQDVDIAYSKMEQAQAELGVLDAMVSYTQIIAPFDGVITGRFTDPGALIRAGRHRRFRQRRRTERGRDRRGCWRSHGQWSGPDHGGDR
jgi:membrane fusion protein (multidrug efflux system)